MHGPTSPPLPRSGPARHDAGTAHALGAIVRRQLAGWPLPLIAVETSHSLLRGTATPTVWGAALHGLHGDDDDGPWAALADRHDLLGLPAAVETWGRRHVAVGASLMLPDDGGAELSALLLAPSAAAYAKLCRLLSWRHEDSSGFAAWLRGTAANAPEWDGVVALVDDEAWALRLHTLGAEVTWRSGLRPRPAPPVLAARGIATVAAPVFVHLDANGQTAAAVLAAIRLGTTITALPRREGDPALTDLPAMRRAYAGWDDLCAAGAALLRRCRYVPGVDEAGRAVIHLPPSPHHLAEDADAELRRLAEAGVAARYGTQPSPEVRARLEHELAVISSKGFAGYILTVHDLAKGRRTCGRGSGASSLVVFALGITNVDPIRYTLLFERFMAPERTDPPDIDVDFPWDERDDVIQAALERYGSDRAALVATHQTLSHAAAVREAARAYGLDDGEISVARQQLTEGRRYGAPVDLAPPWPAILSAAALITGGPRHLGVHCGGVVITATSLRSIVPVHPAAKEIEGEHVACIAWEKDGTEAMGLVKIDLLGNRSLAVIRDALADMAEDGITINEHRWRPEDDPATRNIVASGGTMGCFYIESPAMRQLGAKVGSGDFDRLVVHSSIIRPAANKWIGEYIKRYHHARLTGEHLDAWYPHPALRGLLSESYGILSYQEDVMLTCQRLAGFGSKEANVIRKALGKPDAPERLRVLGPAFFAGCATLGVARDVADSVWDMISSFAGYSFCKAHSASYAVVSFQCAYLKAHHPAHFLARVVANQGGFYGVSAYLEEARRLGAAIRGPCVLMSALLTRREGGGAIRAGLHLVPGLSQRAAQVITADREHGRWPTLTAFARRCRLHPEDLDHLHASGALDGLLSNITPAQRSWLVAAVGRRCAGSAKEAEGQQALDIADNRDPEPPRLPAVAERERRRARYALLGFLAEAHPLTLYDLPPRRLRCRDVTPARKGARVTLIALAITRKQVTAHTRTGDDGQPLPEPREEAMSFVTLEDETALIETVWFPQAYRAFGVCLERGKPIRFTGKVQVDHGVVTVEVDRAEVVG
jgi:DNA polymerase-3 subunit alpha/error-prone DNA polymerase